VSPVTATTPTRASFYTLQLAGRNADKLEIKTLKYKTGKILHPMMNLAVVLLLRAGAQRHHGVLPVARQAGSFTSPLFNVKTDADAEKSGKLPPLCRTSCRPSRPIRSRPSKSIGRCRLGRA
jgi:hypothetical protein